MNRIHRWVRAFFLVAVIGAIFTLPGCTKETHSEAAAPVMVSNLSVVTVQKTSIPEWLDAVGTVRAAQMSPVSSQAMGNIIEIRAHEGDRVQAGEVVARIDDAQPRSAVEQASAAMTAAEKEIAAAESDLALAGTTLKRYQQLYDKKSVSPQEFDEVKARYQSAEARRDMAQAQKAQAGAALRQAQISLSYTNVRAPFAGIITEKKVDVGAFASPGMPIFTVEATRNYRLEANVDESDIGRVRMGQRATVTVDSLGAAQISGKVVEIVPAADPASRSFLVKVALPADARLRSGLFGRAEFPRGSRSALLIPAGAVVERGQLQAVYAVDANRMVELRYITLGRPQGDRVEVLSGLQDGDKLVAAPGEQNLAGKRITTQP